MNQATDEKRNKRLTMVVDVNRWLVILLAVLILAGLFFYGTVRVNADLVLKDARNVNTTMRLLNISYQGEGKRVYSTTGENGLSIGTAEEIAELSGADGTVELTSWNNQTGEASGFAYIKGHFVVHYQADEQGKQEYIVSYLVTLLDFQTQD